MNAVEHAYESLRAGILAGHYGARERLGEVELAALLKVSRTPVREALRKLSAEGLVDLLPNRGARVATWTTADIEEIYDLRVCLESYGTLRAAARVTDEDVAYLEKLVGEEKAALTKSGQPVEGVLDVNAEYHRAIVRYADSGRLYDMVVPLIEVQRVLRTFRRYSHGHLQQHVEDHRVLIQAFRARDPQWAEAVMRAHLIGTKESLLADKRVSEAEARNEFAD